MSRKEINPYESGQPEPAAIPDRDYKSSSQVRVQRYRWCTIPAALSWFVGVALLLCGLLWVYQLANGLEGFPLAAMWMLVAIVGSGALNLYSGRNWMRSRWMSALSLNIVSVLLLWFTATAVELYIKSH